MVCEVAMVNYWIAFLTGGLCIGLVVFLGLIVFFRRYLIINSERFQGLEDHLERRRQLNKVILEDLREKEKKIEFQLSAIQSMISSAHHRSENSNLKTIRGLISVYRLEVSRLIDRVTRLGGLAWAEALANDFLHIDKQLLSEIEKQCIEGEEKIMKSVEQFNDIN
jgi:hypothetical protein